MLFQEWWVKYSTASGYWMHATKASAEDAWNYQQEQIATLQRQLSEAEETKRVYEQQAHYWLDKYRELEGEVERLRGLLGAAKCPNADCDGTGHIAAYDGRGEVYAEHCRWCHESGRCCQPPVEDKTHG